MPPSGNSRADGLGRSWLAIAGRIAVCAAAVLLTMATASAAEPEASASPAKDKDEARAWNWHGQSTFVEQGHGGFRSPYQTDNSLRGGGQGRETFSLTGSLGLRLWYGGELYINPEVFQGFGLASTHGLGGFSNGEAQKGGSVEPIIYIARAYYKHTFGYGGETEKVTDDFNQLPGIRDISRLTLTIGRFAVNDFFDGNTYAKDSRTQFLNYSMWASGGFDYGADQKGYGGGIVLDYNQKTWAFRAGYVLLPIHPNAQNFSWEIGRQGQYLAELELRYAVLERAGVLRLLAWTSRANSGSYREAVADPLFDGEESIQRTWRVRTHYGYGINWEQAVSADLGVFARWSWRDAQSEVTSWSDIDHTLSAGLALKGSKWGRPNDTLGLGAAVNGLSRAHADYFAAGGIGVTVGDGQINYNGERMLEAYYAFGFTPNHSLTFDYQYVTNPAYNADRGPVSIFAARLHGQF